MATTTRTRKAAAAKTAALATVHIEARELALDVEPGTYKKVTTRTGKAFLLVMADGQLSYTNRRGEVRPVNHAEFVAFWNLGLNTKVA